MKPFSIRQAIHFGWVTFKQRPLFFIVLPLIPIILSSLFSFFTSMVSAGIGVVSGDQNSGISLIVGLVTVVLQLIAWVVSTFVTLGVNGIYKETAEGGTKTLKDIFSYKYVLVPFLLASIVTGFVSVIGFVLFIIPGIIWVVATQFYVFSVLGEGTGPLAAINESLRVTHGARMKLFLFGIVLFVLNAAGAAALLIGLLVTMPISWLAFASVYQELKNQTDMLATVEK